LGSEKNEGHMNKRYDMKNVTMFAVLGLVLIILLRVLGLIFSTVIALDIISMSAIKMYYSIQGMLVAVFGLVSDLALLLFFIALIKRQK
jgi:hypothetical protein